MFVVVPPQRTYSRRLEVELPSSMAGEVEVQLFARPVVRDFDLVQYLTSRDWLAADIACLVVAVSGIHASANDLWQRARSNPCANLLPQQVAVRLLWTVGRHHRISEEYSQFSRCQLALAQWCAYR